MCIRDRGKEYGLHVDPTARVEATPVGMRQRVEILKTLYRGCLLYTSDAADERSSVDLGGRRIIKKKKAKKEGKKMIRLLATSV